MLFSPGGTIHTFFMRFPLDVAFLSREGHVLRVAKASALASHARPGRDEVRAGARSGRGGR